MLADTKRRAAYDAALNHSRKLSASSAAPPSMNTQIEAAFSYSFGGKRLTFDELVVMVNKWENEISDVKRGLRAFASFLRVILTVAALPYSGPQAFFCAHVIMA